MREFLSDFFSFLAERKKWWLAPVVLILIIVAAILIFAEGSAVGGAIYTLF